MVKRTAQDLVYHFVKKLSMHLVAPFAVSHSKESGLNSLSYFQKLIQNQQAKLKYELLAQKRLLYIGDNNQDVFLNLQKNSFSFG